MYSISPTLTDHQAPNQPTGKAGAVAVVPIYGPIGLPCPTGDAPTDPAEIQCAIQAAADDPETGAVLLVVHSPGGAIYGIDALAKCIRATTLRKPVVTFAQDLCCSAAYWVASQSNEIWCGATAEIGAVGVTATIYDTSQNFAQQGITPVPATSGSLKGTGTPGVEITKPQADQLQHGVDLVFAQFKQAVVQSRPQTKATDEIWEGRIFIGQEAVDAGLADQVSSFEECFNHVVNAAELWIIESKKSGNSGVRKP